MSREIKIRTSYAQDAAFLARLCRAIELDPKLTPDTKRKLLSPLTAAQIIMLDLERARLADAEEKAQSADSAEDTAKP